MNLRAMPRSSQSNPLRGLRILILEDDDDLRAALVEHCADAGAEVWDAGDVRSARALLELQPIERAPFDLLLTDLQLPDGSGHAFADEVRARAARVRVVALTGRSSEDEIDASHAAGFDAHARKPLDPSVLIELLAAVAGPRP